MLMYNIGYLNVSLEFKYVFSSVKIVGSVNI